MKNDIINRDASKSARGYRLQKLRAAKSIFDIVADNPNCSFWCNIEKESDVSMSYGDSSSEMKKELEEDKNYLAGQKMTLNSKAILNTLVMFLDKYHELGFSPNILYHFYTTASIGKENSSDFSKTNQLQFPEEPILKSLNTSIDGEENRFEVIDIEILTIISKVVINEYKKQYAKKEGKGYLESIEKWDSEKWRNFLSKVIFSFNQLDDERLGAELLKLCKINEFYRKEHFNREELLVAMLLEEIEKTQLNGFSNQSHITSDKLELIYEKVKNNEYRPVDSSWSSWSKVDKPTDIRNIEQKVNAVLEIASASFLSRLNRRAANGLSIVKNKENDKSTKALLYIIYDSCEEELEAISKLRSSPYTENELLGSINKLVDIALAKVESKSSDYGYSISNRDDFRDLVLHLVDSCYLAFDGN